MKVFLSSALMALALWDCGVRAADRYKTNNADNLELGTSWTNGVVPGASDVAVWDAKVSTPANCTNALGSGQSWGGIRVLNPAVPVKVSTANSSTLSLGGSGIDLNEATTTQDLWLALPVTTSQPQAWAVKAGRTLTLGDTGIATTVSGSVTLNGHAKFANTFNISDGGTLTIPDTALLEPTLTVAAAVLNVGNNSAGGIINQTGGTVTLTRTDGTSGSPKSSMVIGNANNTTSVYNLTGGTLIDDTPGNASIVTLGNSSGGVATWNIGGTSLVQVVGMRLANAANVTATVNMSNNCSLTIASSANNNNLDVGRITSAGTTYNSASLNLYGGTLTCLPSMNVPHGNGPGFFNLYGGTAYLGGNLNLQDSGSGNGVVNVNAGSLTVSNSIVLPAGGSGTGTFNLNGGSVTAAAITRSGTNSGTLVLNGGVLKPRAATTTFIGANVTVLAGTNGAAIDTAGIDITIPAALLHSGTGLDGGLIKLGAGTLTLSGTNSYNGPTVVSNGTLLVNGSIGPGNVTVLANATLGGTGTVLANVTVNPGGALLSGLTITGTVTYVPAAPPVFAAPCFQNPTNLVLSGSGGSPDLPYYVLSSTNLTLPISNWTVINSGLFDGVGNFRCTNVLIPSLPAQYFRLSPSQSVADGEIVSMLSNLRDNGFDNNANINNGLGGLWINWRYGTSPLLVNFNGSGFPDTNAIPRHDDLTDLRYLHNLLWYKSLHFLDTRFDADVQRYTPIVKYEFTNSQNERGWIYDEEFVPMWQLSGDNFFRQQAMGQAAYFANSLYKTNIGAYYKTSSTHTNGYYRVDWEVEIGCALVQAGTTFTNADWVAKGNQMVQYAYDHAYLTNYHLFLQQMDNVFLPDGTINTNQSLYRDGDTDGGSLRFGSIGQEALSLLHVYQVTTNPVYLARAIDMLDPLTVQSNLFGLWDTANGGYFEGMDFPGNDFQNPGQPSLANGKKEAGRQITMLEAFHVANSVTTNRYAATEAALLNVALQKAYYAPGHGVLYEVRPDWTLVTINNQPEDWVTTEAMGIVLETMFSLSSPRPW
jgi:autotransporter-associated beta strand protein